MAMDAALEDSAVAVMAAVAGFGLEDGDARPDPGAPMMISPSAGAHEASACRAARTPMHRPRYRTVP